MRFLLDTGILLGIVRDASWSQFMTAKFKPEQTPNMAFISVVSKGEINSLAIQLGWGNEKRARLKEILSKLPSVGIEHDQILEKYAEIDTYSKGKNPMRPLPEGQSARRMEKNDLWIAATASALNASLITVDKDFDHLKGIFLDIFWIDQNLKLEDA